MADGIKCYGGITSLLAAGGILGSKQRVQITACPCLETWGPDAMAKHSRTALEATAGLRRTRGHLYSQATCTPMTWEKAELHCFQGVYRI